MDLKSLTLRSPTEQPASKCLSCKLTNADNEPKGKGSDGRVPNLVPAGKWTLPGKYDYRYLLVLVDTFPGWTEALPHQA